MLPNFFLIGAPKAGTTSMYNYLAQHPAIYMSPVKEPTFFATDLFEQQRRLGIPIADPAKLRAYLDGPMHERRNAVVYDWEQYLKLFKNVRDETAVGEASTNYLPSIRAPEAIRASIPHARIVMLLRNPVERLFSQHSQAVGRGEAVRDFLQWVEELRALESSSVPTLGPVWNGFYARHLARWRASFPAAQFRIYLYEDYSAAPLRILRDLFSFLEVDADYPIDVSQRHNVSWQPRFPGLSAVWRARLRRALPAGLAAVVRGAVRRRPPQITPVERAKVLEIYEADIRELQHMLQVSLSAWLGT